MYRKTGAHTAHHLVIIVITEIQIYLFCCMLLVASHWHAKWQHPPSTETQAGS